MGGDWIQLLFITFKQTKHICLKCHCLKLVALSSWSWSAVFQSSLEKLLLALVPASFLSTKNADFFMERKPIGYKTEEKNRRIEKAVYWRLARKKSEISELKTERLLIDAESY